MNIWEHIGELRHRLLISLYVFLGGLLAGAFAVNPVIAWLAEPIGELVFVHPTEAFTAQLKVAAGISLLLSLPVWLYHAWTFVASGLTDKEKRYVGVAVPTSYLFFMAGAAFSSFLVFPRAVEFLLTFKSSYLTPMLSVDAYLSFFIFLGLTFGVLFQLPLALHFLAKMGILRAQTLTGHRRATYLVIFILATLLNPVPEVLTQLVLAGAAIVLFELSILLIRWETRPKT